MLQVYNTLMALRLVVVDDAPFIHEILRHLFSEAGILIVGEAFDGDEAVRVVLKTQPDVVLMDIVMPRKSGLEAAKEILKKLPDTRIIACSTVNNESMVMRVLEAGCVDFITKPFSGQELIQLVKNSSARLQPKASAP